MWMKFSFIWTRSNVICTFVFKYLQRIILTEYIDIDIEISGPNWDTLYKVLS